MSKEFVKGVDSFFKKEYEKALLYFSLAAKDGFKEAKIGAVLSDFALESEAEAEALFEYFLLSKNDNSKNIDEIFDEILQIVDDLSYESEDIEVSDLEQYMNEDNSIRYEDFIELVEKRGSFKKTFEDIMFSTKVLISKKDDFVDFLDRLIDNGFTEISMNYIENAIEVYPNDKKLISLMKKVKNIEDRNSKQ